MIEVGHAGRSNSPTLIPRESIKMTTSGLLMKGVTLVVKFNPDGESRWCSAERSRQQ
jgi:hypothetical protein